MRRLPRLAPTVIVVSGVVLLLRLTMLWHDAGAAFAATSPAPAGEQPPAAKAPAGAPAPSDQAPAKPAADAAPSHKFSPQEIQILQELAKRRGEIDQRGEELDRREMLLKAAEQRVDEKIAHLQQMQTQLDAALAKSQQQDDDRIKSLVHIYETMKPAEAAVIFEGMDMPTLLELLTRMKDLKTAPILAAMAPEKARAVTLAMAQRKDPIETGTN